MLRWFVPCWSGDFRLEADTKDENKCVLTVENPTAADREKLGPFIAEARTREWIDALAGIQPKGKTTIPVNVSMLVAGPVLAAQTIPEGDKWTAIRHADGTITVEDGTGTSLVDRLKTCAIEFANGVGKLLEPVAAATVAAPATGCPAPETCNRRASEVLAAFSTRSQYESFLTRGYMRVIGNATGKAYRIYHRDEAARLGMGHTIVHDIEAGFELCAWDDTVPAEEEALSLKLALEHREAWLLNMSADAVARAGGLA